MNALRRPLPLTKHTALPSEAASKFHVLQILPQAGHRYYVWALLSLGFLLLSYFLQATAKAQNYLVSALNRWER